MILAPLTLRHLLTLCEQVAADERAQHEALIGPWSADAVAADYGARTGLKFLLLDDGVPIAAGGWDPVNAVVWQSWMLAPSAVWATHGRAITRHCRQIMDSLLASGARRLQLTVLENRAVARAWYARGLGMSEEGTLSQFGVNGENAVMYTRLRGTDDVRIDQ